MAEEAVAEAPPAQPEEITMGALIGRSIGTSVSAMKEHQAGLRAGHDPDHVRKTRVAVRRLRSNLRTFEEFLETVRWHALDIRVGLNNGHESLQPPKGLLESSPRLRDYREFALVKLGNATQERIYLEA